MEILLCIILIIFGAFSITLEVLRSIDDEPMGFFNIVSWLALVIVFSYICFDLADAEQESNIDTSNYEVYINGEFIDSELIDIGNYDKVTYDYENERILIAID